MPHFINISNFYLFGWIVFSFLPYVYFSTKIYELLLYFFAGTALISSIYVVFNYRLPVYFKYLFTFVLFMSFYGGYHLILGDVVFWQESGRIIKNDRYLLWLLTSLLSVVPSYVFTCHGWLREVEMKAFFVIMLIASIYAFQCTNEMLVKAAMEIGSKQEEFAITAVYCFLSILPLVILFKRNIVLQFVFICLIFTFFILGAKRGPVILGVICMLILMWSMFREGSFRKKCVMVLLLIFFFVGIYQFVSYQLDSSPYFALRIEQTMEGYTSGREEYGKKILGYYVNNPSLKDFFLGVGAQGTLEINESFAHNDWIGILYEQGLVGLFLYLLYWISFAYTCFKVRHTFDSFVVIMMLIIIGLGKTMFSMYYLPAAVDMIAASGSFAIVLGYFLAKACPQRDCVLKIQLQR